MPTTTERILFMKKSKAAPRYSWDYYGLKDKEYRKKLKQMAQSGKYVTFLCSAAHTASEMIAEYLLLSVTKGLSYDTLRVKWELREIEQMPCGRTNFYGIRRYFYYLFDKTLKESGKYSYLELA